MITAIYGPRQDFAGAKEVVKRAIENGAPALPLRDAPDVTVIQVLLLVAVHEHSLAVVTATLPVPPPDAKDCDSGDAVKLHGGAENENPFDAALVLLPPGPTALTCAS